MTTERSSTPSLSKPRRGHLDVLIERRLGPFLFRRAEVSGNDEMGFVDRSLLPRLLQFLKGDRDTSLNMLVDAFATDCGPRDDAEPNSGRFEISFRLRSSQLPYRLTLRCVIPQNEPTYPSVLSIFPAAEWYEREIFDLFGIRAEGHPNLQRLLLYPGFAGHPMRKDYPYRKSQPLIPLRAPAAAAIVIEDGAS